jgi:hypothetical protein
MMRGVSVGGGEVVWRCLGCGWMMRGTEDDVMYRAVEAGALRRTDSVGELTVWGAGDD